jgi:nucleoside-diphosphate-sugar epimerase
MSNEVAGYRGVRALVLGASGFIGARVALLLERSGAEVVRAVRDGSAAGSGTVEADLEGDETAEPLLGRVRPAITFNLAGYGVDRSERDEALETRLNDGLVEELCYAAADHEHPEWTGQHLIHAGSALEFGSVSGDLSDPWHCRPTTGYGRSKLRGSEHVVAAVQRNEIRGVAARLFTVYGPGEHAGRLLPALLAARGGDGPIELTEGSQRRDFTYVDDVAEGLLRLGLLTEPLAEGALNLATGRLESVRDFALRAGAELGIPAERMKFGALPTRPEEMAHDAVSVRRLEELVGWRPATSIEEGVRRTVQALST